jgi:hypothetical protein
MDDAVGAVAGQLTNEAVAGVVAAALVTVLAVLAGGVYAVATRHRGARMAPLRPPRLVPVRCGIHQEHTEDTMDGGQAGDLWGADGVGALLERLRHAEAKLRSAEVRLKETQGAYVVGRCSDQELALAVWIYQGAEREYRLVQRAVAEYAEHEKDAGTPGISDASPAAMSPGAGDLSGAPPASSGPAADIPAGVVGGGRLQMAPAGVGVGASLAPVGLSTARLRFVRWLVETGRLSDW